MVLCKRNTLKILNHFDASIYMLTKQEGGRVKPIVSKYTHTMFSRTWNTPCRVDFRMYRNMNKENFKLNYYFPIVNS